MKKKKLYLKNNGEIILWGILGMVLLCAPYLSIGVMHNDELLARYWSMRGGEEFLAHSFFELLDKGRAISCPVVPFTQVLGYIGESTYAFRILQAITIFSNVYLFRKLVQLLFLKDSLANLVTVLIVALMPFSFEPTLPNAYVTLYGIPFSMLLISLIFYILFLRRRKHQYIWVSMVTFFVTCCSYEAFITYTPVFLFIGLFERLVKERGEIKKFIGEVSVPIIVGCVFLVIYVIIGKIFPSNYGGTRIGFTLSGAIDIIIELLKRSFPGGIMTSGKYRFLFEYYQGNFSKEELVRVICLVFIFTILIYKLCVGLINKDAAPRLNIVNGFKKDVVIIITLIVCGILPFLPISISEMYQGNVGEQGFVALPVTYFSYYPLSLVFGFVLWKIFMFFRKKVYVQSIFVAGILCFAGIVQVQNAVFLKEMGNNFNRLENIEDIFDTDTMAAFNGNVIYSTDIFLTKNTLAIHDSYWEDYAALSGKSISISKEMGEAQYFLYETADDIYTIINKEKTEALIFSKKILESPIGIKIDENDYVLYNNVSEPQSDGEYLIYYFPLK